MDTTHRLSVSLRPSDYGYSVDGDLIVVAYVTGPSVRDKLRPPTIEVATALFSTPDKYEVLSEAEIERLAGDSDILDAIRDEYKRTVIKNAMHS